MKTLHMNLKDNSYDITLGRGILKNAGRIFNLKRRVLIVTDTGVPSEYSKAIEELADDAKIITLPRGEATKSFESFEKLSYEMLNFRLTRKDAIVAVGGGVIGDLTGFCAACYMRGIDFYNVPTTTLSSLDSSIGGKCAINLGTTKNIVGAFYQPRAVLIDIDTLKTLDRREFSAGLAEAVKMSLTSDKELFLKLESNQVDENNIEEIIYSSLLIKKAVVEEDEREGGLRKILNFGHSFGHGIEAVHMGELLHGECVALGMIPMIAPPLRERLKAVLKKFNLPCEFDFDIDASLSNIVHDKKCSGGKIDAVFVDEIGKYRIESLDVAEFCSYIKKNI